MFISVTIANTHKSLAEDLELYPERDKSEFIPENEAIQPLHSQYREFLKEWFALIQGQNGVRIDLTKRYGREF